MIINASSVTLAHLHRCAWATGGLACCTCPAASQLGPHGTSPSPQIHSDLWCCQATTSLCPQVCSPLWGQPATSVLYFLIYFAGLFTSSRNSLEIVRELARPPWVLYHFDQVPVHYCFAIAIQCLYFNH